MTATTPALIRAQQASQIRGISPTSYGRDKFREHKELQPLEEWAPNNRDACFRVFEFADDDGDAGPLGSSYEEEFVQTEFTLLVAYPAHDKWGRNGRRGLRDLIDEDRLLIDRVIGVYAYGNYVAGQQKAMISRREILEDEHVWLSKLTYDVHYKRSV